MVFLAGAEKEERRDAANEPAGGSNVDALPRATESCASPT
eukprot:CAMPEP_0169401126 /NCGR_PEP_ID=MMETSP1017-20121227/54324_1 /TAXON_ID=342587 /ORGANISM="Karlodinium micrum, Strain CCMP2283" /LENGTH=39 /DNA_ID= /DNA_START= /DNA_END= /DNA_ORIENTATION=